MEIYEAQGAFEEIISVPRTRANGFLWIVSLSSYLLYGTKGWHREAEHESDFPEERYDSADTMNIILIGFTSSGKTTVGRILARERGLAFHDLDTEIEWLYLAENAQLLKCREIFARYGRERFTELEARVIENLRNMEDTVLSTGGGVILNPANVERLRALGTAVYLKVQPKEVLRRMKRKGLPAFIRPEAPLEQIEKEWRKRDPLYRDLAKIEIDTTDLSVEQAVAAILKQLPSNDPAGENA